MGGGCSPSRNCTRRGELGWELHERGWEGGCSPSRNCTRRGELGWELHEERWAGVGGGLLTQQELHEER